MSTTLLEILDERAEHIAALEELLFEVEGDVSEECAEAAITAWLAEADIPLRAKLDAYGAVIRERELRGAARKAEAERYGGLAEVDLNTAKRLKARLHWLFVNEGIEKMETERFKFTLANNGGKAPVLIHVSPSELPEWARRVTVSADTEAIRGEIEERERTGAMGLDFAAIGERGRHLRIK